MTLGKHAAKLWISVYTHQGAIVMPTGLSAPTEPTRLAAIRILHNGDAYCVDLIVRLEATQSRMSWHMDVRKQAGLVVGRLMRNGSGTASARAAAPPPAE